MDRSRLFEFAAELHNLRRLAIGEGLDLLAHQIDMAALLAADMAHPEPRRPATTTSTRMEVILSQLRQLKAETIMRGDEGVLAMFISQAVDEAERESTSRTTTKSS